MKYAVIGKFYDSGRVTAEVRPAKPTDKEGCVERRGYDEYTDIFPTKKDAEMFAKDHLKA